MHKGLQQKLTRANWSTWIERIKDYILALDHDEAADIWNAYEWEPPAHNVAGAEDDSEEEEADPGLRNYQRAANAQERRLRVQHNKAYKYIRNSLSDEVFERTIGQPASVPQLLRHLRDYVNDGSVIDRATIRDEYQAMKLEDYSSYETYEMAFKNKVIAMRKLKMGLVQEDEDVLHQFNKGLPAAWDMQKSIASAQQMSYEIALAYYLNQAKSNQTLPGTVALKSSNGTGKLSSNAQVNFADSRNLGSPDNNNNDKEICRNFARTGHCKRGKNCRYRHVEAPSGSGSGKTVKNHKGFQGNCHYCNKRGHKEAECRKKKADTKKCQEDKNGSSHVTNEESKGNDHQGSGASVSFDGFTYTTAQVSDYTLAIKSALARQHLLSSDGDKKESTLLMVLDGGSTVGVVQSEEYCINVRDVNLLIKVGGEGKPNYVTCKRAGILPITSDVDGRRISMKLDVRIIPGFGVNIIPECFFLMKKFAVNKLGTKMEILTPDNKTVLRGDALKHDSSWLFYVEVRVTKNAKDTASCLSTIKPDLKYVLQAQEGEREQQINTTSHS